MHPITFVTAVALLGLASGAASAFTVNSTGNGFDNNVGNAECWTGAMVTGGNECTLRAAIQEVNAAGGGSINFSGVSSITGNQLPTITAPVVIDGAGGVGGRMELAGTAASDSNFALVITAGSSTIMGLSFADGLKLMTGGQNVVVNNYIGTDATGMIAKFGNGLLLDGSPDNMIKNNVISGNDGFHTGGGLVIKGAGASGNEVTGNRIGTDPSGTMKLSNGINSGGIVISNAPSNTIGGSDMDDLNLISGTGTGVVIFGAGASGNLVIGNFIGTDINGTVAIEHFGGAGVSINDAPNNTIGSPGFGNLISGNNNGGIRIAGATATGNKVQSNLIGTDSSGNNDVPISADDQFQSVGVRMTGASGNLVGGRMDGEGNTISGNDFGVAIEGVDATANRVEGNDIGPGQNGGPLGNNVQGVYVLANSNVIGGPDAGAGNVIAHNGFNGVGVLGGVGNAIVANRIFNNTKLGIDLALDNVTPNDEDADDADTGANNLQNYPEFFPNPQGALQGTLDSVPSRTYRIEFFSQENCDPSGHGEGETIIGSTTVNTNGSGLAMFTPPAVARGFFLTATATELVAGVPGSTSEFSPCASAQGPQPTDAFTVDSTADLPDRMPGDGRCATTTNVCTLRAAIQESNILAKTQTIAFNLPTAPFSIKPGSPLPVIDRALFIDGLTQPGAGAKPVVELDGSNAGIDANGLLITGGKSLVRGLVINRFKRHGIVLSTKGKNRVEGNFIGTDVTGESAQPNELSGILIQDSPKNLIGPLANVISGNKRHGIELDTGADKNIITGNAIGTDVDRAQSIPNLQNGVRVGVGTTRNLIGGDAQGMGNVIAGNADAGIKIFQADKTLVLGNFIGTNEAGAMGLANVTGIIIDGGKKNEIGAPGVGNIISGNVGGGVLITLSEKNEVVGNLIGTQPDGITPRGNTGAGVRIFTASKNTVGGKNEGDGNVIAANEIGVAIDGPATTKNEIKGNFIGVDREVEAEDLGNLIGVVFLNDASVNTLADNVIIGNGAASGLVGGVIVLSGTKNAILRNRIEGNDGQSIDLGGDGLSPNDLGDADTGGNDLQNAPQLTTATHLAGKTTVQGTLSSTAKTSFTVELFFSETCTPAAPAAEVVLGKKYRTKTGVDGKGQFAFKVNGPPPGPFVTAAATAKGGNTSELAVCIPVAIAP